MPDLEDQKHHAHTNLFVVSQNPLTTCVSCSNIKSVKLQLSHMNELLYFKEEAVHLTVEKLRTLLIIIQLFSLMYPEHWVTFYT